jgi:hypothetical protein
LQRECSVSLYPSAARVEQGGVNSHLVFAGHAWTREMLESTDRDYAVVLSIGRKMLPIAGMYRYSRLIRLAYEISLVIAESNTQRMNI